MHKKIVNELNEIVFKKIDSEDFFSESEIQIYVFFFFAYCIQFRRLLDLVQKYFATVLERKMKALKPVR